MKTAYTKEMARKITLVLREMYSDVRTATVDDLSEKEMDARVPSAVAKVGDGLISSKSR